VILCGLIQGFVFKQLFSAKAVLMPGLSGASNVYAGDNGVLVIATPRITDPLKIYVANISDGEEKPFLLYEYMAPDLVAGPLNESTRNIKYNTRQEIVIAGLDYTKLLLCTLS